jgi:hypothetical protein
MKHTHLLASALTLATLSAQLWAHSANEAAPKTDSGWTAQLSAIAPLAPSSTAPRLSTGNAPGRPRQTGQTLVFGSAPYSTAQEQNILLRVLSWT